MSSTLNLKHIFDYDQKVLKDLKDKLDEGDVFHGKTSNYRKDGSELIMEWKSYQSMVRKGASPNIWPFSLRLRTAI